MVQANEILGQGKAIKTIFFFLDNPGEYSQIELIKKIGLAKATAVKWFNILVKSHILILRKIGPTNLYVLNEESEFVKCMNKLRGCKLE